jgi:hypothetical protein
VFWFIEPDVAKCGGKWADCGAWVLAVSFEGGVTRFVYDDVHSGQLLRKEFFDNLTDYNNGTGTPAEKKNGAIHLCDYRKSLGRTAFRSTQSWVAPFFPPAHDRLIVDLMGFTEAQRDQFIQKLADAALPRSVEIFW